MAAKQRERRSNTPSSGSSGGTRSASRTAARRTVGAREAAERAREMLDGLVDAPVEGVSGVCRTEEGWRVGVDVLELSRIPDTTSLLATYEVDLDTGGELLEYCRIRRFRRGAADGE